MTCEQPLFPSLSPDRRRGCALVHTFVCLRACGPHSVRDLATRLEVLTGVAQAEQILLYGPPFTTLSHSRALIDAAGKSVFLFSRAMLAKGAVSGAIPALQPQEVAVPSSPPSSTTFSSSATDSASPLVRALTDYERQLLFHRQQGDAWADGAQRRAASVVACCNEVQTQANAAEAAVSNLRDHADAILRMFTQFQQLFDKQQAAQTKLLEASESDLAKLREVKLHTALRVNSRETLWDCVPVDRLRVWAEKCTVSHGSLRRRTDHLAGLFGAMRRDVAEETLAATVAASGAHGTEDSADETTDPAAESGPGEGGTSMAEPRDGGGDKPKSSVIRAMTTDANELSRKAQELVSLQEERVKVLRSDYDACCDKVRATAAAMPTSTSESTDVLDACRMLESLHQRHQSSELPDMADTDAKLAALQRNAASLKASSTQSLLETLQRISSLQSSIRDLGNRLAVLREAAQQQQAAVGELRHVQCMPTAYEACIAEVARRGQYGRTYLATAEKMAEKLAKLRDDEVLAREKFLKRHGRHLPRDLIPGLNERPPHAEIRTRAFDTMLPVISIEQETKTTEAPAADDNEPSDTAAAGEGKPTSKSAPGESGVMLLAAEPDLSGWDADPEARERELRLENAKLRAQLSSLKAVNAALNAQRELGSSDGSMGDVAHRRLSDSGTEERKRRMSSSAREETKSPGTSRGSLASGSSVELPAAWGRVDVSPAIGGAPVDELRGALQLIANNVCRALSADASASGGTVSGGGARGSPAVSPSRGDAQPTRSAADAESAAEWTTVAGRRGSKQRVSAAAGGAGVGDAAQATFANPTAPFAASTAGRGRVHAGGPSGRGGGGAGKGARIHPTVGMPAAVAAAPLTNTALPPAQAATNLSVTDILSVVANLLDKHKSATVELQRVRSLLEASDSAGSRIAFTRFEVGDTALFLPTCDPSEGGAAVPYLAFNEGVPHCYLAPECVSGGAPDYVVGRITELREVTAGEEGGPDPNPFLLPEGTVYKLVTVEALGSASSGEKR